MEHYQKVKKQEVVDALQDAIELAKVREEIAREFLAVAEDKAGQRITRRIETAFRKHLTGKYGEKKFYIYYEDEYDMYRLSVTFNEHWPEHNFLANSFNVYLGTHEEGDDTIDPDSYRESFSKVIFTDVERLEKTLANIDKYVDAYNNLIDQMAKVREIVDADDVPYPMSHLFKTPYVWN